MDFFTGMQVSASGLGAQRTRMNVASSNMANAQTARGADGQPFRRRDIVLESTTEGSQVVGAQAGGWQKAVSGVRVADIVEDQSPPRLEYDPGHPDADAQGYVALPNINMVEEMVDMITASRAYEAGVTALNTAVTMAERAISIGR